MSFVSLSSVYDPDVTNTTLFPFLIIFETDPNALLTFATWNVTFHSCAPSDVDLHSAGVTVSEASLSITGCGMGVHSLDISHSGSLSLELNKIPTEFGSASHFSAHSEPHDVDASPSEANLTVPVSCFVFLSLSLLSLELLVAHEPADCLLQS